MPAPQPRPANTNKAKRPAQSGSRDRFPQALTVIVHPDGSVSHLHHDGFDFRTLGPRRIRRASHVEPLPDGSAWEVRLPDSHRLIATTTHRDTALAQERAILNTRILPHLASAFEPL